MSAMNAKALELSRSGISRLNSVVSDDVSHEGTTYMRWNAFAFTKKFAITATIAAGMASFLFGYNIGVLNASIGWISAELYPCTVDGTSAWDEMLIPQACMDVMLENEGFDIADQCHKGIAVDDRPTECTSAAGEICTAPSQLDCNKVKWYNAILTSSVLFGAAISASTSGKLMMIPKKNFDGIIMVIFVVATLTSVSAGSIASITCARFLAGLAVGMAAVMAPVYIAEMTPVDKKGIYGTAHQVMITIGILLAVLLGLAFGSGPFLESMAITDVTDPTNNLVVSGQIDLFQRIWWRIMMGSVIIPVIINGAIFMKFDMYTPREYYERGLISDCKECLMRVYATDKFETIENYYDDIKHDIDTAQSLENSTLTMVDAMKIAPYRKMILIGCAVSAIQQLSGINVFVTASNQLFAQAGVQPSMVTVLSVIMTTLNVVMTFPTLWLIEALGRKSLMVVGITGQCVGSLLPTLAEYINPTALWAQILSILGVYIIVCSFSVAMGPVLWVWMTEIFPAEVARIALPALVSTNWAFGVAMVFVGTSVTSNKILFTIFLVLNVLSLIFVAIYCKETKGLPSGVSPYMLDEHKSVLEPVHIDSPSSSPSLSSISSDVPTPVKSGSASNEQKIVQEEKIKSDRSE